MIYKPQVILQHLGLWVDAIIDPNETRKVISLGIDAANNSPITEKYNTGVLQT